MVYRQYPLYRFLDYCEDQADEKGLEKSVLDCGAGGSMPPLGLFSVSGYRTAGIESSERQIERAREFQRQNGLELNIVRGDMRELPFGDDSFSFIYSYNSVFHLSKGDISCVLEEMKRVAKPGGLIYLNLLTDNDEGWGKGEVVGPGEFLQEERGEKVIHSFYTAGERENLFSGETLILKEERILDIEFEDGPYRQGFVDFILELL